MYFCGVEKTGIRRNKANELVELAKEKGTPIVEKTTEELRLKAINVTKDVLRKLEKNEKPVNNPGNKKMIENKQA